MADAPTSVGPRIRARRQTRGLSQFELASRAGLSVRHISFIETGRAQPSREAVLALGEVLDLPLRECNRLLESACFAHVFRETSLSADELAHMRGIRIETFFPADQDSERSWRQNFAGYAAQAR
jgi:transcriptional regulator with XRE-family HTH domain